MMTTEIFNDLLMVAYIIGCVANAVVMACFYLSLERDSSLLRMPKWFHAVAVAVCVAFSFVAWILVIVARLADKLVKIWQKPFEMVQNGQIRTIQCDGRIIVSKLTTQSRTRLQ